MASRIKSLIAKGKGAGKTVRPVAPVKQQHAPRFIPGKQGPRSIIAQALKGKGTR